MENLFFSLTKLFPLFAILLLGYFLGVKAFLDEQFITKINKLCFRVLMPSLIFSSIYSNKINLYEKLILIRFAVICIISLIAVLMVSVPVFVKENSKRGVMIQGMFRSNFLFFGIPIIENIYGEVGVASAAILNAIIIPIFNISSVVVLEMFNTSKEHNVKLGNIVKNILKNPLIIASSIALILVQFDITIPIYIEKPLEDLSEAAIPLAILALGAGFRFKNIKNNTKHIIIVLTVKLVIVPTIVIFVSILAGFRQLQLIILVVLFASPVAVASYIMATDLGGDGELAGQLVVISTIMACLSMFIFIYLLKSMGLL